MKTKKKSPITKNLREDILPGTILQKFKYYFEEENIAYMLLGGRYLFFGDAGIHRHNLDFILEVDIRRSPLIQDMVDLGFQILVAEPENYVSQCGILPLYDPPHNCEIDLIFSTTPFSRESIKRARTYRIAGVRLPVPAPEDIIVHKILSGSLQDLGDVNTILLQCPSINGNRIIQMLNELGYQIPVTIYNTENTSGEKK